MKTLLLLAFAALACAPPTPATRVGQCNYVRGGAPGAACCTGCGSELWCNTASCTCEDITDPCGATTDGGTVSSGTPDAGVVPTGTVDADGGTVDRLWFATTGDTRPGNCDQTGAYPQFAITQVAQGMKALRVQFALDLGDHMYVCNGNDAEAQTQMGYYMTAIAQGPSTFWMTMGNHECGNNTYPYSCFTTAAHDANFSAYMSALKRPLPYYSADVQTSLGKARFVIIADDSWNAAQASWLESTLADADLHAKYTIIARHHPVQGSRTGNPDILTALQKHKYTMILTAHDHSYSHDTSSWNSRSAVVGIGGAGGGIPGFGTVLQNLDGTLTFVERDANGNPLGQPWSVAPQ